MYYVVWGGQSIKAAVKTQDPWTTINGAKRHAKAVNKQRKVKKSFKIVKEVSVYRFVCRVKAKSKKRKVKRTINDCYCCIGNKYNIFR